MDFSRTPGFGGYTLGPGLPHQVGGQLVSQTGVWGLSRSGNTVTAQLGDIILAGDIESTAICHSIVVSRLFQREISNIAPPDSIKLTLYIDGIETQSVQANTALVVEDPSVETVIGDPQIPGSIGSMLPPVILNTAIDSTTAWDLQSFSQELCEPI